MSAAAPARAAGAIRRLLPGGRLAGPMPWILAIMIFLTVLATAAGLGLVKAARGMAGSLDGQVTIQIVEANVELRTAQRTATVAQLRRLTAVTDVTVVPDAAVRELLRPWLGAEGLDRDIPVPALIDARLVDPSPRIIADVTAAVRAVAPGARVDRHSDWVAPLSGLLATLVAFAIGLVALAAAATAAAVMLGARAALDQHRVTIDTMHLMGATDRQIARLFERGVARDALTGALLGFVVGVGALIVLGGQIAATGAALLGSAGLGWPEYAAIAAIPLLGVALSIVTARITVLHALARIL